MLRMHLRTYRGRLRATLASQGVAYGFTLTIWGTGALTVAHYGAFTVVRAFLYVLGPLLMYALLLAVLYGPRDRPMGLPEIRYSAYAFLDFLSVPVALLAALLVFRLVHHPLVGIPLGSFLASLIYNLLLAAQVWIWGVPQMEDMRE